MRVKTLQRFRDFKSGTIREIGEEFVCNKDRYNEIESKLPGFICEVKKPTAKSRRR